MAVVAIAVSAIVLASLSGAAIAQDNSGYATYSNGNGGVCSGSSSGLPGVAMNAAQFGGGSACGQCVQIQGTGNGAGTSPVSTAPYIAVVTNVCPSCAPGDIDLQESGSGRFGITWSFVACPGAGRRLIEEQPADEAAAEAEAEDTDSEVVEEVSSDGDSSEQEAAAPLGSTVLEASPVAAPAAAPEAEPASPVASPAKQPASRKLLLRGE